MYFETQLKNIFQSRKHLQILRSTRAYNRTMPEAVKIQSDQYEHPLQETAEEIRCVFDNI